MGYIFVYKINHGMQGQDCLGRYLGKKVSDSQFLGSAAPSDSNIKNLIENVKINGSVIENSFSKHMGNTFM